MNRVRRLALAATAPLAFSASGAAAQHTDPHAGHAMPAPAPVPSANPPNPHTDHQAPPAETREMAGTHLPAGNAAPPPVAAASAADAIYGEAAMTMGRHHLLHHHGGQTFLVVTADKAEVQSGEGSEAFVWEAEAWYGGDIHRLVVTTEGESEFGSGVEAAEVQVLYSRAIDPYFNLQAGVRFDVGPGPSRTYAMLGFEGLAPGFVEVQGALFLSDEGELLARLEASQDQRITQRLILQPRAELEFAAQGSREIGVGKGLAEAELGLRLRYEITRELAPYIGVEYARAFGETRRFLRDEGEDTAGLRVVAGVRLML